MPISTKSLLLPPSSHYFMEENLCTDMEENLKEFIAQAPSPGPLFSLPLWPKPSASPLAAGGSLPPLSQGQFLEQYHPFHPISLFSPWAAPRPGPRSAAPQGMQVGWGFPRAHSQPKAGMHGGQVFLQSCTHTAS